MRYSELKKKMYGVSGTMLSSSLKELCDHGILEKTVSGTSVPETSYSYTQKGAELIPILESMFTWGDEKMLADGIRSEWSRL